MTKKFRSYRTETFHKAFAKMSNEVQQMAIQAFQRWKEDPASVGFKPLNSCDNIIWSAQISGRYRALAKKSKTPEGETEFIWFWMGSHEDYNNVIKRVHGLQSNIGRIRQNATTAESSHISKPKC